MTSAANASPLSFGEDYANLYDAKYSEKKYEAECDAIERVIAEKSVIAVSSILDVGCGSGEHSLELVRRGYRVTGIDQSSAMIAIARNKAKGSSAPQFLVGDATHLELGQRYDAVILMFAVLSYMDSNSRLIACLKSVERHLKPGGIVFADFWYGPSVLADPPRYRESQLDVGGESLLTRVRPHLDLERNVCILNYEISRTSSSSPSQEEHRVRYFFLPELKLALDAVNLEFVGAYAGEAWDMPLTGSPWTAALVARHRL